MIHDDSFPTLISYCLWFHFSQLSVFLPFSVASWAKSDSWTQTIWFLTYCHIVLLVVEHCINYNILTHLTSSPSHLTGFLKVKRFEDCIQNPSTIQTNRSSTWNWLQICQFVSPRPLLRSMRGQATVKTSKETSFKIFAKKRSKDWTDNIIHHPWKKKKETGPIQKQLHQTNPRSKEVSSAGSVSPASSASAFENFLFLPAFDLRTIGGNTHHPPQKGVVFEWILFWFIWRFGIYTVGILWKENIENKQKGNNKE